MSEKEKRPRIIVMKETLPSLREEIAGLREQKGKEEETLRLITPILEGSIKIGEHEHAVNLHWERYLVGKHYLMRARSEKELGTFKKAFFVARGLSLMRTAAKESSSYIERHNVKNCRARSHRFSGEIDMISQRYESASRHFQTGVELFGRMDDPEQRQNALELSGFLAEVLVLSGRTEEGIDLAKKTFRAYDEGDGALLKERDYYTWAVWKSGCMAKLWGVILDKKIPLEEDTRVGLFSMLGEAYGILFPKKEVWGDFQIRRNEVNTLIERTLKS
jgi:hypothetical protein